MIKQSFIGQVVYFKDEKFVIERSVFVPRSAMVFGPNDRHSGPQVVLCLKKVVIDELETPTKQKKKCVKQPTAKASKPSQTI